jgi:hypothetical protein
MSSDSGVGSVLFFYKNHFKQLKHEKKKKKKKKKIKK